MFRLTTNQNLFTATKDQSTRGRRSLLDRPNVRVALMPQAAEKNKISFSATGYYDDETDITIIHDYVLKHFQQRSTEIPHLDEQINQLQHRFNIEKLKMVGRKALQDEILELQKKKEELKSDQKHKEYLERISSILSEWNSFTKTKGSYVHFGEKKNFSPDKLSLVRSFVQIASEYIPLNLIVKPTNRSGLCPYCRKPFDDNEAGKIICYECGVYQDSLTNDVTFSDLSRINGANNNNYINRETFEKDMANYQGKERAEFPLEMSPRIDEYCVQNRMDKYKLNPETTRDIFKRTGYSGYYDHTNLFLFMYIERRLPDISQYESILLQDYDLFSQKYQLIKGDDRDSSLNAQYVLYILMRRRKIPYELVDFKLPDTRAIRLEIDRIARKVFEALEADRKSQGTIPWKFEDTI